jgi:hypothetical protein
MEATNHKNDTADKIQKERHLVEQIYIKLNQGNLFEIYQIIESLEDAGKRSTIERVFKERYNFDFRNYI